MPGPRPSLVSGRMLPAPEPSREALSSPAGPYNVGFGGDPNVGTSRSESGPLHDPVVDLWLRRFRHWRDGFSRAIAPNVKLYWRLWRNFDDYSPVGPTGSWRDSTVVPEPFKLIETTLPRTVLGLFGGREWMVVQARRSRSEQYEEMVRTLMESKIEQIGAADRDLPFIARVIDGLRYSKIMGHVWWRLTYRRDVQTLKTKLPEPGDNGRISWTDVEEDVETYAGLDLQWLPLDSLAVNLTGPRRWAIEKQITTLEDLEAENEIYQRAHGRPLYNNLDQLRATVLTRDDFREPQDTEHWPLTEDNESTGVSTDETRVELWLCWDNRRKTLTKIANRSVVLDHGQAPTPDGLDPYFDTKAVPIPGRVYGDSILNWTKGLNVAQTRIKRGRMDEVVLSLWQQFVYRAGTLKSAQNFLKPGGAMGIETLDPSRPIGDSFMLLQRRPVLPEAYQEEQYCQSQAEAVAGADPLFGGVEATTKSRDVAATEIQQRVAQGNIRYQLETLYHTAAFKQPLLYRAFRLLKQNLTEPEILNVLGEEVQVDLTALNEDVDFKFGGGLFEISQAERGRDIELMIQLTANPMMGPVFKPRQLAEELLRNRGWRDLKRFIKTEEELAAEQQQAMAAQMAQQAMAAGPGDPNAAPSQGEGQGDPGSFESLMADVSAGSAGPAGAGVPAGAGISPAQLLEGVSGGIPPAPTEEGPLVEEY